MYEVEATEFATIPDAFMHKNEVYWKGTAPEDFDIIKVRMALAAGKARIRTGSRFLGLGNRKASVPKWELRGISGSQGWVQTGQLPEGADFDAWWSGYKAGAAKCVFLDDSGPPIMLTPTLDGCTVVCLVLPNGSAWFAHYNLKDENKKGTLAQETMAAIAEAQFGSGVTVLSREQYNRLAKQRHIGSAIAVTVVGKRSGGTWSFWAQYREDKISGMQIRRVEMLA